MLAALVGLTVVVLTADLLGYSDLVINRGVGAGDVAAMLFYQGVPVAARMFPFSVLVGLMVALGRLGADREILALESCGVSAARLVWPAVSFSGLAMLVALVLGVYATPWASRKFDEALLEVSRTRPWAQLRAGEVNEFGGWRLEAREVSASGTELQGVLLFVPELGETIFARSGELAATEGGAIQITLRQGSMVLPPDDDLRLLRFETVTTVLPDSDSGLTRDDRDVIQGLPLDELMLRAREFVPTELDRLPRAALELHRRFAYAAASLVFGFLAVPLFIARGNYSRAGGGVLGLACTIAYYALMQLGEGLVQGGFIGVALGAWLPDLVLGLLAAGLLARALRERVAGQAFDRAAPGAWRRWLPRRAQRAEPRFRRPRLYPLPRYIAGRFVGLLLLTFSVLFVAYLLIDIMNRLEWFTRYHAGPLEVVRFYGARVWLLASRAVPMAMLVATALIVSLLAVEGELIGMRSCGIAVPRALLPVLVIACIVAPLYFVLNNVVVPRANSLADVLKRTEIKREVWRRRAEERAVNFWYRSGRQVIEAARFDTELGQARSLTIFELGEDGLPTSRIDASRGRHIGQGWWQLTDPTRVEVSDGHLERVPAPRHAQLGETVNAEVDTMHLPANEIAAEARSVEADGFDATPFWVDYYARLAEPFSCIVLPAVVLFFAVTGPPYPGPATALLASGILGVGYILLVAVASSLGRGEAVPPLAAAWGPVGLYGVIAAWLFGRMWRRL